MLAATVAERLKGAGYATASIGTWHLGDEPYFPEHQGFDRNVGGCDRGQLPSCFSPSGSPTLSAGPSGEFLTDREAAETVNFIEANRDRPFFLYLPRHCVQTPIQAKPAVKATSAAKDAGGLVSVTDNAPARAGKGSAYEGGVGVPFIVSWLGVTRPGTTSDVPVITLDTRRRSWISRRRATPQSAIRSGNWRLVHFYEAGRSELYDLNFDPGETTDVAAREPLRTAMLQAKLDARREEVNAQLPTPNADHAPVRDGPKKGRSSR